jgi:predicted amidohydrolase YtcJ
MYPRETRSLLICPCCPLDGAVVVRDGKIVSAGPAAPAGAPGHRIDAQGMTVMPGFIDAHRHIINGNDQQWFKDQATVRKREFPEAGYTTLMSGGGPVPGIVTTVSTPSHSGATSRAAARRQRASSSCGA